MALAPSAPQGRGPSHQRSQGALGRQDGHVHVAMTFFKGAPVALCPSIPHGGQLPGVSGWPRGSAAHTSPSFGSTATRLASPRASHALTNLFMLRKLHVGCLPAGGGAGADQSRSVRAPGRGAPWPPAPPLTRTPPGSGSGTCSHWWVMGSVSREWGSPDRLGRGAALQGPGAVAPGLTEEQQGPGGPAGPAQAQVDHTGAVVGDHHTEALHAPHWKGGSAESPAHS